MFLKLNWVKNGEQQEKKHLNILKKLLAIFKFGCQNQKYWIDHIPFPLFLFLLFFQPHVYLST